MCSTQSDGISILIKMDRIYSCENCECIHKYELHSNGNRLVGGEELENACSKNNKAITQEIPPNNTDLPMYDSKIQVGGLSFYNWKYK